MYHDGMARRKNECGQFNMRVSDEDLRSWKKQADAAGVTLTQWIKFKCNGIVLVRTETKVA